QTDGYRVGRDDERRVGSGIADERIPLAGLRRHERRVVHPALLDELELLTQIGIQTNEAQASVLALIPLAHHLLRVWPALERIAARPATDHLRAPFDDLVRHLCLLLRRFPEGEHVLLELAEHEIGAVATEIPPAVRQHGLQTGGVGRVVTRHTWARRIDADL